MDGVNLVTCLAWIKRGVCKQVPDKVQLTREELASVIEDTKGALKDLDAPDDECDATSPDQQDNHDAEEQDDDPYKMATYDEQDDDLAQRVLSLGGMTQFADNTHDPYVAKSATTASTSHHQVALESDSDSDAEDLRINSDENLICIGEVDGDLSQLVFYVFNENLGSMYVHHDIMLSSCPLCVEWLNYDRQLNQPGNLVAVGGMSNTVDLWDVDVVNVIEPAYRLGERRKGRVSDNLTHTDAVLSLAWNSRLDHILASGSADNSVLLWDLECGRASYRLCCRDKVQSLTWRPSSSTDHLLSGDCARHVRLWHCSAQESKRWKLSGEVEQVIWDHFSSDGAVAVTDDGQLHYIDVRVDSKPVWSIQAHPDSCTGVSLSSDVAGCLVSVSADGCARVWDLSSCQNQPSAELLASQPLKLGRLSCVQACSELSWMMCVGGDRRGNNLTLCDIRRLQPVRERFCSREAERLADDQGHPSSRTSVDSSVVMTTASKDAANETNNCSVANEKPPKIGKKFGGKKRSKKNKNKK